MDFPIFNFLLHILITFCMTGIIWFVHLIHYPVMAALKTQREVFEKIHWEKTMKIAVTMLTIEGLTSILFVLQTPENMPSFVPLVGLFLIIVIWITTWGICVPSHCKLKKEYNTSSLHSLMNANKWRAILWTLRSALMLYALLVVINQ